MCTNQAAYNKALSSYKYGLSVNEIIPLLTQDYKITKEAATECATEAFKEWTTPPKETAQTIVDEVEPEIVAPTSNEAFLDEMFGVTEEDKAIAATPAVVESPLKAAAIEALARDFHIFSLLPKEKLPFFGSSGFKDAKATPDILDLWDSMPEANIGIATGESNLCVLDFDQGLETIPAWVNELRTFKVRTAKGLHVYLRGARPTKKLYVDGALIGDMKSIGGYVLAAGSVHPSGAIYTVVDDSPVVDVPEDRISELLKEPECTSVTASSNGPKIPHGSHDTELTRIAGKLRAAGLEEEGIYTSIVEVCEKRCDNYGRDYKEMCRKISHSVCNYAPGSKQGVVTRGGLPFDGTPATRPKTEPKTKVESVASPTVEVLTTVNGDDFLVESIPPRKALISTISSGEPVIFEQSINQIFAWRGSGKTCLGLGFTKALATGGAFLNFKAAERTHCLYVEGEMPDSQFQERWRSIVGKTDGFAHLSTIDKQPGHYYDSLATEKGMEKVEKTLAELAQKGIPIKVLLLDNISTLFNVAANDEETWIVIQSWFTSLRSRGITIIFFHHAGKAGLSRSHSKSEDMLDVSIKLEAPEGEQEKGHLHAIMSFDKVRAGLSERPAEIKLHRTHSSECYCRDIPEGFCPGDGVRWEYLPIQDKKAEAFVLFANGGTPKSVAAALDIPLGTAKTWRTIWGKQSDDSAENTVDLDAKGH
jgi:Bifunctional DNA primase/polymerase, N-terminal/AAA domain